MLGRSLLNIAIVIGVTSWPGTALLIRSQTLSIKERPYLERARVLGAGRWHQMTRHILPNVMPMVFANTTLTVAVAILAETTLSFLGLGDPTRVSWGSMLDDAFSVGAMTTGAWWFIVPPGVCVVLVVLAFTLVGQALEEIFNPRLRGATRSSRRPLLEVRDLRVSYLTSEGRLPAVRGVDLVVRAGEVVGVAGESGCGKSTLASTVLRLQPQGRARSTGEVLVDGEDVLTMRWGDLRALRWAEASIVFQGALHSLNPVHRVGDQIAEPIRLHEPALRDDAGRPRGSRELLEQVGLPRGASRAYPHQLSGGQTAAGDDRDGAGLPAPADRRRRADHRPRRDGAGADPRRCSSELVRDLGVGLMIISHDLSVLADVCDRVAVMYAGRIVETGTVAGGVRRPAATRTPRRSPARSRGSATRPRGTPRPGSPATRRTRATCRPGARSPRAARCVDRRLPRRPSRPLRRPRGRPAGRLHPGRGTRRERAPVLEATRGVSGRASSPAAGTVARALDGVDCRVGRGEVLALVGESGSGKTTLARTLVGLERPTAGEVPFEGGPLDYSGARTARLRRHVQMVLQDAAGSLNPRQTVYESVAEGIRLHKRVAATRADRTEVDLVAAALAEAGLRPPERFFLRYPHELSGGQRQRVLIAGALALRPQC